MSSAGARLLLVEDDPISRAAIHQLLDGHGYAIFDAEHGEAARRAIASDARFDCILMDRGLPDCDGLELLREVKGTAARRDVPIIMQTARADLEAISEGISAGALYYLTKPLQRALLVAVVEAAIAGARELHALRSETGLASRAMGQLAGGTFRLRTLEEARDLARALAGLCPEPEGAVLVLQELLINAIEHGNLGIDYGAKTSLLLSGRWHEEIEQRLQDPVLGARNVTVELQRSISSVAVTIVDEGAGFDWTQYLELSPERAFDPHGRGILIARTSGASQLEYTGSGNTVTARWLCNP